MVVQAAVSAGKLRATLKPEPADAFIIAVPTPFKEGKQPDISYIHTAAKAIAPLLRKGNLVILESTSPVGTTEQICAWIGELRPDLVLPEAEKDGADIHIAHCPERVLPGSVLRELVDNDRIIGGISPRCAEMAAALYRCFVSGEMHLTNARTAELAKLVENSYRDVNIAFANELSIVCDKLDINVWELIALANRIRASTFSRPVPASAATASRSIPGSSSPRRRKLTRVIRAAREVNDGKPDLVVDKVAAAAARMRESGDRLPRPVLQGRHRRSARKPGAAHRRASGARRRWASCWWSNPMCRNCPRALPDFPVSCSSDVREALARGRYRRAAGRSPPVQARRPRSAEAQDRDRYPRRLALRLRRYHRFRVFILIRR